MKLFIACLGTFLITFSLMGQSKPQKKEETYTREEVNQIVLKVIKLSKDACQRQKGLI